MRCLHKSFWVFIYLSIVFKNKRSIAIEFQHQFCADNIELSFLLFALSAKNSSCNFYSEFECGNSECIDYELSCDGTAHCKDKSDEKLLYCGKSIHCGLLIWAILVQHLFCSIYSPLFRRLMFLPTNKKYPWGADWIPYLRMCSSRFRYRNFV